MAHTHHPHLFSHEWAELHPELVGRLKQYGVSLTVGVLMAYSALLVIHLEEDLHVPLKVAATVNKAADGNASPGGVAYFPDQFFAQIQQAQAEELPPQF